MYNILLLCGDDDGGEHRQWEEEEERASKEALSLFFTFIMQCTSYGFHFLFCINARGSWPSPKHNSQAGDQASRMCLTGSSWF